METEKPMFATNMPTDTSQTYTCVLHSAHVGGDEYCEDPRVAAANRRNIELAILGLLPDGVVFCADAEPEIERAIGRSVRS